MTQNEINRLTRALENGSRSYYVYALCLQDGTPFYIGKGVGARMFAHELEAADAAEALGQMMDDEELTTEDRARERDALSAKIRTIIDAHGTIKRVIVKWGLTSEEAFMCESAMINILTFARGCRLNSLTNIVNGHASGPEKNSAADVKTKARTGEEYLQECAIEERPIDNLSHRIAFININRFYPLCFRNDGTVDDEKVRECVRGLWRVGARKASRVQFVFALYRQRVVGVYHVTRPARSLSVDRAQGLPDFPSFPQEVRYIDRLKSTAGTLDQARGLLSEVDYNALRSNLEAEASQRTDGKTADDMLRNFQSRVYFVLDNDVPPEILIFKDCFPTKNGTTDFIRKGHAQLSPVILNF